jgi:Asp-tRNA(Asn)/Glu-tRNA(Gln) amidotransferase A subunit family amidase
MALSWTQDRLGPICRYAEDCAIVMQAIAKPDGRDMSVSDVPFNWDAQLDIRKLKVGYIKESFDEISNEAAKANAQKVLDTLRSLGVSDFTPVTVPTFTSNVAALGIESAAFFDHMTREGKMTGARGGGRKNAWLTPAVEYLQTQRVRTLMMMKLAEATAGLDVYVVGSNNTGGTPGRGGRPGGPGEPGAELPAAAGRGRETGAAGEAGREGGAGRGRGRGGGGGGQGPTQRHFTMANLACYPAINVPNGFAPTGQPTNVVFYARPFGEAALLALAKAYQDAAGFHLQRPTKLDVTTSSGLLL